EFHRSDHILVPFESGNLSSGSKIPELHHVLEPSPRCEHPPVRRKRQAKRPPLGSRENLRVRFGGEVPQLDGTIRAARCQGLAVWRHRDVVRVRRVPPQRAHGLPRSRVPEPNQTVRACCYESLAVWGKSHPPIGCRLPSEGLQFPLAGQIPEL